MPRVLLVHKPKGCVVTRSDELGRKTVYDLLPPWVRTEGWVPVGRLDRDSRGLLLFVREGHLVESLGRPGALLKTYEVWVRGRVTAQHLDRIRCGVPTALGPLRCEEVHTLSVVGPKTRLSVLLSEGKNRHIRRLFGALKDPQKGTPLKVVDLKRTRVGPVTLDLPSGTWRFASPEEESAIFEIAGVE